MKNLIIILALLAALCGCSNDSENLKSKFSEGQIVESVLTGQRGQVVHVKDGVKRYLVRFQVVQGAVYDANGGFLSGADKVQGTPFALVEMKEFELKAVED